MIRKNGGLAENESCEKERSAGFSRTPVASDRSPPESAECVRIYPSESNTKALGTKLG